VAGERILAINGPNLNLLGRREPGVYGTETLDGIAARLRELAVGELACTVETRQSNQEGVIIDWIHEAWDGFEGVLINPGAFTHYSYAIRDAISAVEVPVVEVHISNPHAREEFRHVSTISGVSAGVVTGFGAYSYELGLRGLIHTLRSGA